jgi:hypothetical protein
MYLSAITVELNDSHSLSFNEFSVLLNQRCPGLKAQQDIVTNYDHNRFMITGFNPRSSLAIAELARLYNLTILRLDLTFCSPVTADLIARAEYLEYMSVKKRLHNHLTHIKYRGHYLETTRFDTRSFEMGAEKSDKQLFIRDKTDDPAPIPALQIVWRLRGHHARAAWQWVLLTDPGELQEGIDLAFCAATNTFLGPDWFHLGHDQRASLQKEAKPVKPKSKEDWQALVKEAVSIIIRENMEYNAYQVEAVMTDFIAHELGLTTK